MRNLKKRVISIVLVVLLLLAPVGMQTALADPVTAETVRFSLSSAVAAGAPAGYAFVDVTIRLDQNPGIAAGSLVLSASPNTVVTAMANPPANEAVHWTNGQMISAAGFLEPILERGGEYNIEFRFGRPAAIPMNTFATGTVGTVRFVVPNNVNSATFTLLEGGTQFGGLHNNMPPQFITYYRPRRIKRRG